MNQNFDNFNSLVLTKPNPRSFLKFNRYSFLETPKVLLLAWDRVFKIKDAFRNKQYKPKDIQELFHELFYDVQNIHEELAKYINTPGWNRPAFYNNGDDDDEDCTIAITPDFLITDSLIMGDEHLDTIPEKESDEFIKSSVENLVPNPSEFKDECECDVPGYDDSQTTNFSTFSNHLFDDSTSSDDESSHEETFILLRKNDRFDTESYPLESLLNHDTLMASSLKIDSLLAELAGELIFLKSIPPGIDEANSDPEEDIHLVERLFLLHLAVSQPMLKSLYKAEDGVRISIPPLVRGVGDVVVEIKGTVMADSKDSAVTYTSVYTEYEPGRVFWGTDEEVSEGGVPRVIVYGYDGFLILPVPQDEEEREPRFIQAHDPDFVPEPLYLEYIPLEDEHVLLAEEQPLPPVESPTTESPGYVAESDPEEDPEYEDDEEQDGPVDYPMGEGDDGGDDDGNSSRDDAADEDEDIEEEKEEEKEEEEEEEHIASADSTAVIPVVELVSSPEGTKPVLPPPSIDITTIGAKILVRLQASVSLPSTVDVERLLALPTPPLLPLTSLSPPFAGEQQAPPSPDYVLGLEHADNEIVAEDQPYAEDASPIAQSPEYAHPEDDDDEDLEEDPVDYLTDRGVDGDDEEESSEDDEDDDMDVEADEEEEEEHPAPTDSVVVAPTATDQAPSAEEIEPFETDEFAATPPPHLAYRVTARISIPAPVPMPAWTNSE
nr:hypothetical protein [Tanacetum cinerariifolium]